MNKLIGTFYSVASIFIVLLSLEPNVIKKGVPVEFIDFLRAVLIVIALFCVGMVVKDTKSD